MTIELLLQCSDFVSSLEALQTRCLTDVYAEGCIDNGYGIPTQYLGGRRVRQFVARWSSVYLELEDALVRLSVDVPSAGVRIARVASFSFDDAVDEDDEFGVARLGSLLIDMNEQNVRVTALEAFLGTDVQSRSGVLRALGLVFPHCCSSPPERYLFIDPLNLDGIALGRREERDAWMKAAPNVVTQVWRFGGDAVVSGNESRGLRKPV
jgi:hypothetical protein